MSALHAGHAVDCVRVQLVVLSLVMAKAAHIHAVAAGRAQLAPASFRLTIWGASISSEPQVRPGSRACSCCTCKSESSVEHEPERPMFSPEHGWATGLSLVRSVFTLKGVPLQMGASQVMAWTNPLAGGMSCSHHQKNSWLVGRHAVLLPNSRDTILSCRDSNAAIAKSC